MESAVNENELQSGIELLDHESKHQGATAAIDPQIMAATITGGAAIVVALIPIIADIFRKKTETTPTIVNVTLHGTANSKLIQSGENKVTMEEINEVIASIGSLTEIDVS